MESLQKVLLLLSVLAVDAADPYPSDSDCPDHCHCSWVAGKKSANCSYAGLTYIPTPFGAGTEIQVLNLTGNALTKIRSSAFMDWVVLQRLLLRGCNLVSIDKLGLKSGHWATLVQLDLSKNLLRTLHNETFQQVSSIRFISLNDNQLEELGDGLFSNLPHLERVELSHNKIVQIGVNTFMNVPKLSSLTLDNNRLEYLKVETLNAQTSLSSLELNDNPWRCDCKLQPLTNWVMNKNLYVTQIACTEPANLHGKLWKDLGAEDLACQPDVVFHPTKSANVTVPLQASNTSNTLTCQVNGNPLPALHWAPNSQWEVKYYVCGEYLCMAKTVEERVHKLSTVPIPFAV